MRISPTQIQSTEAISSDFLTTKAKTSIAFLSLGFLDDQTDKSLQRRCRGPSREIHVGKNCERTLRCWWVRPWDRDITLGAVRKCPQGTPRFLNIAIKDQDQTITSYALSFVECQITISVLLTGFLCPKQFKLFFFGWVRAHFGGYKMEAPKAREPNKKKSLKFRRSMS